MSILRFRYEIDCKEIKGLTFPLTGANFEFISL